MPAQIEGMTQLLQRIEQMGRTLETQVKEKALKESAELMKDKVVPLVPVRTGKLRQNIIVSDIDVNETIHIGPDQQGPVFYSHFLEFGTKKMSPKPFLGPAYENNKEAVQNKMAAVIRRELNL